MASASSPSATPGSRLDQRVVELAQDLVARGRDGAAAGARIVPERLRRLVADAVAQVYAEPTDATLATDRRRVETQLAEPVGSGAEALAAKLPGAALALRATRWGSRIPGGRTVTMALGALDVATVVRAGVRDLQTLARYLRAARPDLPPAELTRRAVTAYLDPDAATPVADIPLAGLARHWGIGVVRPTSGRRRRRTAARRARAAERLAALR
jgi:hypothetical protein